MITIEALKRAYDATELSGISASLERMHMCRNETRKVLREAIAAEEAQTVEPVAYLWNTWDGTPQVISERNKDAPGVYPVFTRPAKPADHSGDATKLVDDRAALIATPILLRKAADMLAADALDSDHGIK